MLHYAHMADLFDYPRAGFADRGRFAMELLREEYPDASADIAYFMDVMPERTLDLQELHTRTFDVQSLTTLDIGYVLFGDDYKRGALLANINQEHRRLQNDCRGELGDHLPNVLRLMSRLDNPQLTRDIVVDLLIPALLLMIREFDTERSSKKDESYEQHYWTVIERAPGSDPMLYVRVLRALLGVLARDFEVSDEMLHKITTSGNRPQTTDFLAQIQKEMTIETSANPTNSGCDH